MSGLPIAGIDDLVRLLPLLAAGFVLFVGSLVLLTAWRLTRPPRRTYGWAVARNRAGDPSELDRPVAFEERSETLGGRRVAVWDIAGRGPEGPVVILTHGWGESRIHALNRLDAATAHASRVVAWDMPGHGDSAGATSLGPREAAALAALVDRCAPDERVVLWGWSLGAEVTLRAAAAAGAGAAIERRLAGVVLESPFRRGVTPARAVLGGAGYPSGWTLSAALALIGVVNGRPGDRFADLAVTAGGLAGTPVLVVHGSADAVSPVADGRAIAAAGGGLLVDVEGAGHADLWASAHRDRVTSAVAGFLSGLDQRSSD